MAERSVNKNYSAFGVVFAIFAAGLLAVFFAYRGTDVGRIGALIGQQGGGALFGFEGLGDSLVGVFVAALIGFSWFGVGTFVWRFLPASDAEGRSEKLDLAMKIALGAAIWSLVWFFLGNAGAYSIGAAAASVIAGVALAAMGLRSRRRGRMLEVDANRFEIFDKLLLAIAAIQVLLAFIASLAPPIAKDTLLYHFSVPKAFLAEGGNGFVEGNIASYLALGTEMHVVWGMLLGNVVSDRAGEAAAGATTFLFFPLLLLAVYGWAREIDLSGRSAILAVLAVACIPTAFHVASSGYIDLAISAFITLAVASVCRWWRAQDRRSLILTAVFLGAALSVKLTALFAFAAIALVILMRARNAASDPGKIAAGGFAALILAAAIASPWYLRTWKETGSPVFPFYMSIWKGEAPGWDVERSNLFQAMNTQYGGADKGAWSYVTASFRLSLTAQPEQAEHFDGVLGPAFLFGTLLMVMGLWKLELPVEVNIASGVAVIMFLFWLFSSQQLRYLLPIAPMLAISIVAAAKAVGEAIGDRRQMIFGSLAVLAIAPVTVSAAWFMQKAPLRVVFGGEAPEHYLARNLDYYPFYQELDRVAAPDDKVWLINMRRDTYHLDRPYFSDYLFEDWTLRQMVSESRSAEELRAKTAAMGVQYVLARHDFMFDFDRSPLVDDKLPRAENDAKLKMARDLILDPRRTVRADKKFSLVRVF